MDYQTKMSNVENTMKSQYETNQEEADELSRNQKKLKGEVMTTKWKLENQKKERLKALLKVQKDFADFKKDFLDIREQVRTQVTWKHIGPSMHIISTLIRKLNDVNKQAAEQKLIQQDSHDLREQLQEYRGLTVQLQEEK